MHALKIDITVVCVQVMCPIDAVDVVRMAMGDAGAGRLGNYSHAAFVTEGTGYFLPLGGAHPAIGTVGAFTSVSECMISCHCAVECLDAVMSAIRSTHPYEEIPISVIPLLVYDAGGFHA